MNVVVQESGSIKFKLALKKYKVCEPIIIHAYFERFAAVVNVISDAPVDSTHSILTEQRSEVLFKYRTTSSVGIESMTSIR